MPDEGPASLPLPTVPTAGPQSAHQAFLLAALAQEASQHLRNQEAVRAMQNADGGAWTFAALSSTVVNFRPGANLGFPLFTSGTRGPLGVPDTAAERRAYALLETAIGADVAAKVAAGGGYEIPSRRMSGRLKRRSYLVPREGRVKILEDGLPVGESCILSDASTPWPDQVLHKIKAIQADETVVFATGNVTMVPRGRR